uniref:Integron gene cassette protein n=1 Tax=uncultured bacterium TaxID=77133 RepID=A0ACD6B9H1_9BACT|nr:putative integron gene cassette protein [uncultured bacterium]
MSPQVRTAHIGDVPVLVRLMSEFYQEAGFALPHDAAIRAFKALLGKPDLGRIWLIAEGTESVGYIVLTLGFSMEYGGLRGFVDDFFVRPNARGKGLGAAALQTVKQGCCDLGVRALLVETGPEDHPARGVYSRAGFEESGRMLLGQALAPPIHEA